ncbi:hypothetical protein GobsT_74310 [Gemmata obscuriglobus]|uniref:Uncharacterized protein n=1 Tax=Gemmata obscuriglobus TaxID=114 RepID=A0A2Z3HCR6_9BACT|nr:hypothetical protein [Gemmata obscuriglobus]AWM41516.1 hypothetical protein C1280_33955 [Gemmata obscuriglobus]QEG32575.1 hypothetical protein GobsT_74310 [Gemmata obscuriglobus]VTS11931.1 unnamed protein product [Gemmata obscuriglobus UQM 2246]
MHTVAMRAFATLALGLGAFTLPVLAEDSKPKPSDWSGYVFVADVVGEVVKADDKSVTLRITWFEPQARTGNSRNGRPGLSQNNRNFRNPYSQNMNRPNQSKTQLKEQHHDYELEYVSESLVRSKTLPVKLDEKGKKIPHNQKEIDELRAPGGFPGYAANRSDLTPGTIVEVYLIRDKSVPAAKAGEDDLRVKYAVILGRDPNPPKDIGSGDKNKDKKKDEKKKN